MNRFTRENTKYRKLYDILYENRYRIDEEREEKVVEYSKDKGLRLKRAYTELIKKGLESEGY